jgi:hypothetical protein
MIPQCDFCPQYLNYERVILNHEAELAVLKVDFNKQCHKFDTYEQVMYGRFIEDMINRFSLDEDIVYGMLEVRQNEAYDIINKYNGEVGNA